MSTKPSLTLKRRLNARPAKVFSAWTDPEKLAQWMGPEGVEVKSAETDVRVGGRYRLVMLSPDCDEHDVSGTYREVVPDEKLVFTWAWKSTPEQESLVTLTFKPDGDGTLLTLLHEKFVDESVRDHHESGWTGALEKLERFVA